MYDQLSPLDTKNSTTNLMDAYLLRNNNNVLIRHLKGREISIHHTHVSLIATHIREIKVELHHIHEEKARIYEQAENKGFN